MDPVKLAQEIKGTEFLLLSALVVGVGVAIYVERSKIINAFNPASSQNLAYQTSNAIVANLSGGKYTDTGQAIADTASTNPVSGFFGSIFDAIGHATGSLPSYVNLGHAN